MSQKRTQTDAGATRGITILLITELKPYGRNARKHGDKQVDLLARSIREFGFNNPVLIDRNRNIVAGHGRFEAAKRLGLESVPTVLLDHLSAAQIRAYRIADNRIAELSDWDEELLRLEILDLSELELAGEIDFEVSLTGFDTAAIDVLIDGSGADAGNTPAETVEEPEPDAVPVTRAGEMWTLGRHRILCADALQENSYAKLMAGETARMIFSDPPYNVPINGHVRIGDSAGHREFAMAVGEMSEAQFREFLRTAIRQSVATVMEGGICMFCIDWRHVADLIEAGKAEGLALINLCVWNKSNAGMGSLYRSKHEMVCVFKTGRAAHVNNVELGRHGRYRTNVWDYAGVNTFRRGRAADLADHPTVKPTALVADAIRDVSHKGEIVLDPFSGSGATLLAAEKTGRTARVMELDAIYVDVAIRRWQALTGQDAVSADTGETFNARATVIVESTAANSAPAMEA